VPPLNPVWAGLRLIQLAILAPSNEWVGWLTESGPVCWLWAVSWGSPQLGVTYVQVVVGQFRLLDMYKLCRVRNTFEWSCPRYRIDYGVDLTCRFWVWWFEFYLWLCLVRSDDYCHSLMIIVVIFSSIISMHLLDHGISIYCFTLTWWGGTCGVHCTHMFVVVVFSLLIPTLTLEILSS
jgi:hypothetical protein